MNIQEFLTNKNSYQIIVEEPKEAIDLNDNIKEEVIEFEVDLDDDLLTYCKSMRRKLRGDWDNVNAISGVKEGIGKCQPKGSKVLMANGEWKNIEDIKPGDEILSPQQDGSYTFAKVIDMHNRFSNENYDIVQLNRQRKKLYSCAFNHEIPINFPNIKQSKGKKNRKWIIKNIETKDFYKLPKSNKKNITTFSAFPIPNFKDRINCEIEPYTLGVFLGDGSFSSIRKYREDGKGSSGNWLSRGLNITSNNFEIIEEVSKFYPIMAICKKKNTSVRMYRFSLNEELSKQLTKCGLEGKGSGNKFIPKEALLSNLNYRKRLLAGLIDTDGYKNKGQSYSITTKSKQLAGDILNLIYSLGGRGRIIKVKKGIRKLNFIGKYYNVSFYLGKIDLPLKVKYKIRNNKFFYLSANRISIDVIPSKPCQVYGIRINSPSRWYITDNWMITHNTTLGIIQGYLIDRNFDLIKNIAYIPDATQISRQFNELPKYSYFLIDEAIKALYKLGWYSLVQQSIVKMYATERYQNKCSCVIIPRFRDLTENFRNHKVQYWFHVITRGYGVCFVRDEDKDVKDPWHFDENLKYKTKFSRGAIRNLTLRKVITAEKRTKNYLFDFSFPQLPDKIENVYKKLRNTSRKWQSDDSEILKPRQKQWLEQRNKLIAYLKERFGEDISDSEIKNVLRSNEDIDKLVQEAKEKQRKKRSIIGITRDIPEDKFTKFHEWEEKGET